MTLTSFNTLTVLFILYVVSPGSKPLVLWDGPGMSKSATLGEGNRLLELRVRRPDPDACHHLSRG